MRSAILGISFTILLFFCSCSVPVHYSNAINTAILKDEGDINIGGNLSGTIYKSYFTICDMQSAYSFYKSYAIMLNSMYMYSKDETQYHKMIEFGFGKNFNNSEQYDKYKKLLKESYPLGQTSHPSLQGFNIFAGVGLGNANHHGSFSGDSGYGYKDINTDYHKYFIQSSFYAELFPNIFCGYSIRLNYIHYFNSDLYYEYRSIPYLNNHFINNKNNFYFDSILFINLQLTTNLSINSQAGLSVLLHPKIPDQDKELLYSYYPLILFVGIGYHFNP